MTTEAISHGQSSHAGMPVSGRNTSATTPEPIEISVVAESGSSPTLISAFQPAWQRAANRTARNTTFSMPDAAQPRAAGAHSLGPCLLYTSDAADDLTRVDIG